MSNCLFDCSDDTIKYILDKIRNGDIALPYMQRPFVWKPWQVRDLIDSLFRGYPVGHIILWDTKSYKTSSIGENSKQPKQTSELVIDGQQRLSALLMSMYGIAVKTPKGLLTIDISFNPFTEEFKVRDATTSKDYEFISSISDLYLAEKHTFETYVTEFFASVRKNREKKNTVLTCDEELMARSNIARILDICDYELAVTTISCEAMEDEVADIFVRVNSQGKSLTENDFIETLLSVYDITTWKKIQEFCYASSIPADNTAYNRILSPVSSSQLTRISVGYGFRRSRLHYAYLLLRGKDLETEKYTEEIRNKNLSIFKTALDTAVNLTNWHNIMNMFTDTGYVSGNMISSKNAVVFTYMLYLIGKYDYNVPSYKLERIIKKWIFMSTLTSFYTASAETEVESQLSDIRKILTAEDFVSYIEDKISSILTEEYFTTALPAQLETSSAGSPLWFAYLASLNILGNPMLFSNTLLSQHIGNYSSGNKKNSIEKHHIFPKNMLAKIGYTSDTDRNQIANFTYITYEDNLYISNKEPSEYAKHYRNTLGFDKYSLSCSQNAIPENFDTLEYNEFLKQRRFLMARIIRRAYNRLCGKE